MYIYATVVCSFQQTEVNLNLLTGTCSSGHLYSAPKRLQHLNTLGHQNLDVCEVEVEVEVLS